MNITAEDWKENSQEIPKQLTLEHIKEIEKMFKENGFIPYRFQAILIQEARENVTRKNKI